jgi:hypothetical protein
VTEPRKCLPETVRARLEAQPPGGASVTNWLAKVVRPRPEWGLSSRPNHGYGRAMASKQDCSDAVLRLGYIRGAKGRPAKAERASTRPLRGRLVTTRWPLRSGNKTWSAAALKGYGWRTHPVCGGDRPPHTATSLETAARATLAPLRNVRLQPSGREPAWPETPALPSGWKPADRRKSND